MSGSSPGPGARNRGGPVGLARGCVACVGSNFIQNDGKWRPRAHYEPWGGALVPHATAARKRRSNARRNTALTAKDLEPQRRRFVSDRFRGCLLECGCACQRVVCQRPVLPHRIRVGTRGRYLGLMSRPALCSGLAGRPAQQCALQPTSARAHRGDKTTFRAIRAPQRR